MWLVFLYPFQMFLSKLDKHFLTPEGKWNHSVPLLYFCYHYVIFCEKGFNFVPTPLPFCNLTLSWRRSLSYRNQCKSMDWSLYDRNLRHERVDCRIVHFFAIGYRTLLNIMLPVNSFVPNAPFSCLLKTSENRKRGITVFKR